MNTKAKPERVKHLRIEKGFSQEQLAEMAKVGHRTIQRLEDSQAVRPSTLAAVASALGVGVAEIAPSDWPPQPFGTSLLEERRAMEGRTASLLANKTMAAQHEKPRIEVVEVALLRDDEDLLSPPIVAELARRLNQLGFSTSIGSWDSNRLLGKLPAETVDTVYVIHAANPSNAAHIASVLEQLAFGVRLVVLEASEVSAQSNRISRESVVQRHDALVAYRAAV